MKDNNVILEVKDLHKSFGEQEVLKGISTKVNRGDVIAIIGPSGCGKSTFLRSLNLLEIPTSGQILFEGTDLTDKSTDINVTRQKIGMVFQQYSLFPNMTVEENLSFPLTIQKMPKADQKAKIDDVLEIVGLTDKKKAYPGNLSGGQQQRVALARAIISRPKVLLLDEPLSAIDAKLRKNLQIEIRRIQQELNITTIFVTHDQDEAMSMSDRICLLNNGNIEQVSSPIELYTKPKTRFAASFIGHYNVFSPDEFKQAFHVAAPDNKMTAIRPETIQISTEKPQENDAIHTIYGKIINNRSVGNTLHYHIDVNGITFKVDTLFRSFALYKNDQNVWLSLEKRNCLALED